MRHVVIAGIISLFTLTINSLHGQTQLVGSFHKAIISPYIQATFLQGDKEEVSINSCSVDSRLLHVEVKDGTLRIYLDGAKEIPHDQKGNTKKESDHNYPNHAVATTIVYKTLDALSLRGEETFVCQSPLSADDFSLTLYGEPAVSFPEVHFKSLHAIIYGEGSMEIKSGVVNKQMFTCYGEGRVNTTAISGREARLIAYGEANFSMNVSDRIKITSFGEAKLRYKGNPDIVKGLHFGGVELERID